VVREAQRAIESGTARLLRLSPTAGAESQQRPDFVEYLMTCHSGGTLEIFIEPVVAPPLLRLVGETPVVETLAALGPLLGYRVDQVERLPGPADTSIGVRPMSSARSTLAPCSSRYRTTSIRPVSTA